MFAGALTQRRLARLLAVAAGVFMLIVFVAPKGLLESPWSPESSDEKLKHEADRQMDVLTVADTNTGKRRFVMDRLRATFTRNTWGSDRQRKAAAGLRDASADGAGGGGGGDGGGVGGGVGGAGAGARRAEEVKQPEEVSGEKVESRQKPLPVNLPAVKKKKRMGPFSRRSVLEKSAEEALQAGQMALREMNAELERLETLEREGKKDPRADGADAVKACQRAIVLTEGDEELKSGDIKLPCGMRVGSAITVVGMVPSAPAEAGRGEAALGQGGTGAGEVAAGGMGNSSEGSALSFMLEILGGNDKHPQHLLPLSLPALTPVMGRKHVQQQHPAFTLLHALSSTSPLSPLRFTFPPLPFSFPHSPSPSPHSPSPSPHPNPIRQGLVVWGESVRCEGFASTYHEERVDGQRRCEKWSRERARTEEDQERMDGADGADATHLDTEKLSGWQRQVMKQADKEVTEEWPFPFHEDRLFVLVVRAGWEGFHVSVDGNHVASFQYRSGNPLEEATAVAISGAIHLKSFVATSLPLSPPLRTADLEASESLKAPVVRRDANVSMFIGILSATNHFAERTAVRKTWLQHPQIRSGEVVARFFLALHPSIQVNVEVHKEAALYGDMVVLPFVDRYDLVVLKTIAICEYGLRNVSTNYIMKVDDDNFVRLDAVFDEIRFANHASGLYMGNINEFHKPLREGKWAVSEEEWPETNYPPYANGPGYIITRDIASFIVRMKEYKMLRIFKMEDVSMGMWVVQYGINNTIHYIHNWRFCQFGCMDDYLTAHYQSPRQMLCMWTKLSRGEARCCT
ncbi:unnamed protein product [Closterium sp. Yama58-4]|nr:unnamed protein product [Closterium sp. Yama58-4]